MPTRLRIATFNLEEWGNESSGAPALQLRIDLTRPQLQRIDADVLCLQEVFAQSDGQGGLTLAALKQLLKGTQYEAYHLAHTYPGNNKTKVERERNLVVLSRFPIADFEQHKHDIIPPPQYRKVTAQPAEPAGNVDWERPFLHAQVQLPGARTLHVLNVHLKSKLPSDIKGQKITQQIGTDANGRPRTRTFWKTAYGWAEGSFVSAMKRVGQALEIRAFVDTHLFDPAGNDQTTLIAICGDFNSDVDEVPLQAIQGDVENTDNVGLIHRVLVPVERTVPEQARFSLLHHGRGNMLDHILISRALLPFCRGTEIDNELLHDESISFATDLKFPESDHAPVVTTFVLPDN